MNFKKLADQAKMAIDKRGGTESLKRDFKEVAQSKGSFKDKAKAAGDKLKQPGARPGAGGHGAGPADTPPTAQDLPPRA